MALFNKHIENIIEANNNNRLAIFVGAGISKCSETKNNKIPLWKDIIENLKHDLNEKEETDFLKIPQLYYLEFEEYTYYDKIKTLIPDNLEPSEVHELIFKLQPQCIITTNWDNLLEKTIDNYGYIYEVVASDKDLVKSTLQKKMIKMHGDIKHHNFVFKEDDYLNYSRNFPLIENYVKSILSTHTVLFLGFSYSDINLKQITKWIQSHSKVRPPAYLITFDKNVTQIKYLASHGIFSIVLSPEDKSKGYLDFLNILMQGVVHAKVDITNKVAIDIFYKKLSSLGDLNSILLDQLQNILPVYVSYAADFAVIRLIYDDNLSKAFIEALILYKKNPIAFDYKDKLELIFQILDKAGIGAIIFGEINNDDHLLLSNYISSSYLSDLELHLTMNYSLPKDKPKSIESYLKSAFIFSQLNMIEQSYALYKEAVRMSLKSKNFVLLLISMFNKNSTLQYLKRSIRDGLYDKYWNVEKDNIDEKYNDMPRDTQKIIQPIYDFVNFTYLYRKLFQSIQKLKEKEKSRDTIQGGGFVFNSETTSNYIDHLNLILFVLKNNLIIERYNEFRTINENYINIALIRQIQNQEVKLNRIELYAAIKYVNHEDLQNLFKDFLSKNKGNSNRRFLISKEDQDWLIILLKNTTKLNDQYKSYFENIVFLLSLSRLENNIHSEVLSITISSIHSLNNFLSLFNSINNFLGLQFSLYKAEIDSKLLLRIIEAVLNKFIFNKISPIVFHTITSNPFYNLYGYIEKNKSLFDNDSLTKKFLLQIDSFSIHDKANIIEHFLLDLYRISSKSVQKEIKDFALKIKFPKIINIDEYDYDLLTLELALYVFEMKRVNKTIVTKLDALLDKFKNERKFSTIFYTIFGYVEFLYKTKNVLEFESVHNRLKKMIELYDESKMKSII